MYVHRMFYQEAGTILLDPLRMQAAVDSVRRVGLVRSSWNPVLARRLEVAETYDIAPGVPHVVFEGEPEHIVGDDCAFLNVPPEKIICIAYPRRGETLREAIEREIEHGGE